MSDDPMTETEEFPIQCVTLHPLYGSPAQLFIADILDLKKVLGSNSLFVYKSHPVNCVEVSGIVTSVKKKIDCLVCNVDDGSGTIQCYCSLSDDDDKIFPIADDLIHSRLSNSLSKRLCKSNQNSIALGDFVTFHGCLKMSIWSKSIYVNNCKWKVVDRKNADDVWLQLLKDRIDLYKKVYDKPFCLDEKLQNASKSFVVTEAYRRLCSSLEPIVNEFVLKGTSANEFFGFELLEVNEVKQAVLECANLSNKSNTRDHQLLTSNEWRFVSSTAIASLLHRHVVSGHVIKKKCLKHEAITNMDQMDSCYFITLKCVPARNSVKEAVAHIINSGQLPDAYSVLHVFNEMEFNFIRSSKHGLAIVSVLMKEIMQEFV